MKRLIAMLAASILLVGAIAFVDTRYGEENGLYYEVTGIKPDAQIMSVNGQAVCAEEYFYWLASACEQLYSYTDGAVNFDAALTEDMTFGQYAQFDASQTVTLYSLVRQLAAQKGIALTAEDEAALDAQRAQYVEYYGSEEKYLRQLKIIGVSEKTLRSIESVPYLYSHLAELYCAEGGELYPSADDLAGFGKEGGYVTAQLLFFATTDLDASAVEELRTKAAGYVQRWQNAADKTATYLTMCSELGLSANAAGLTFEPSSSDAAVHSAVSNLAAGEISGVIEGTNGFYVALRLELNANALARELFSLLMSELQSSAKVEYAADLYDSIDVATFYADLNARRTAMLQEIMEELIDQMP